MLDPSSGLPGSRGGPDQPAGASGWSSHPSRPCSLFDLAPGGVYLARPVTRPAGELLPHRFTLTSPGEPDAAVYFLLHFPWPRGRWALPITVSFGARTFLPPAPDNRPIWQPIQALRPATVRSTPMLQSNHTRTNTVGQASRLPAASIRTSGTLVLRKHNVGQAPRLTTTQYGRDACATGSCDWGLGEVKSLH